MMVVWFSANIISLKARDLDYSLDDLFFRISEKAFWERITINRPNVFTFKIYYIKLIYKEVLNANLAFSNKMLLFPTQQTGLSCWCLISWALQQCKWWAIPSAPVSHRRHFWEQDLMLSSSLTEGKAYLHYANAEYFWVVSRG